MSVTISGFFHVEQVQLTLNQLTEWTKIPTRTFNNGV